MGYNSYAIEAFAQIYILWNDELHTFLYFAIYTTVAMQAGIEMAPVWQDQFSKDSCSVFAAWAPVRPEWHHEDNNSWDSDVQVVPSPGLISGRFHQLYRWGSWGIRKWLLWLCNLSLVLKLQIPWFFFKGLAASYQDDSKMLVTILMLSFKFFHISHLKKKKGLLMQFLALQIPFSGSVSSLLFKDCNFLESRGSVSSEALLYALSAVDSG